MTTMTYEPMCGESIGTASQDAIDLAAKYRRKVRFTFNGHRIQATRFLSASHLCRQYGHQCQASSIRYNSSQKGREAKRLRKIEGASKSSLIDALTMPTSKADAMAWLAEWIPLSDDIGVKKDPLAVAAHLESIGFIANHHVGKPPEASENDATTMQEYVGGQAVSMLRSLGMIHPHLATLATQAITK